DTGRLVRAALRFSQFPDRPRHRRRVSRRKISGAARPAPGAMAKEPGLGAAGRNLTGFLQIRRYSPRIKSGAGPRIKSGAGPRTKSGAGPRIKSGAGSLITC